MFAKIAAGATFSTSALLAKASLDHGQFNYGTGALPPDIFNEPVKDQFEL